MDDGGGGAMIRLALSERGAPGRTVDLSSEDWHYLMGVMHRRVGDIVEVLTEDGEVWESRIDGERIVRLTRLVSRTATPRRSVVLFQALLKGDHLGDAVERGTEAGIARFVPVVTARSILRTVSDNKRARWQHIAKEASEQSRGAQVPIVDEPIPIGDLVLPPGHQGFFLDPRAPFGARWLEPSTEPLALVVGPEGGLTEEEQMLLSQKGFDPLSLGPRVYRAENAGAFAAVLFLQDRPPTFGQHC